MSLLMVALLQAVSATPPEKIDLTIRRPCEAATETPQDIVVCGRNGSGRYRLNDPLPPRQSDVPTAAVQLADGVTIAAEAEGAQAGGQQSNRLMARIKIKF
ncbi:hypothetical protein V6R86_02055 [Sphingomonas kaistensis]|uniref:DUF4124 domain-containing protein n=1 Tax=Sphingomonas kaistensis TaxID=298708 RepID=A0ABZ2FZ69_9SPHN